MKRLDEPTGGVDAVMGLHAIKARAKVVATKPENREATYAEFGALLRLARFDVPALVAAVEAVLELRPIANPTRTLDDWEEGYNEALDQAKHKIREALGETT